jgi:hypothetical protein
MMRSMVGGGPLTPQHPRPAGPRSALLAPCGLHLRRPGCDHGHIRSDRVALSLTRDGRVAYALKTPYRDGTTHVILEPKDFVAWLAALVPGPRYHLTRYHGVLAPHAKWRALVVPGKPPAPTPDRTPAERHQAMTWTQRLARVFRIDVTRCESCVGPVRIIASLKDPAVLGRILTARGGAELHGAGAGPAAGGARAGLRLATMRHSSAASRWRERGCTSRRVSAVASPSPRGRRAAGTGTWGPALNVQRWPLLKPPGAVRHMPVQVKLVALAAQTLLLSGLEASAIGPAVESGIMSGRRGRAMQAAAGRAIVGPRKPRIPLPRHRGDCTCRQESWRSRPCSSSRPGPARPPLTA